MITDIDITSPQEEMRMAIPNLNSLLSMMQLYCIPGVSLAVLLKGIDGIKKHEAWMEVALKENYSNQNSNIKENRLFTEDFVRRHNWSDIKITQSYCTHPPSCKDYSFKLHPEDFRGMLTECYEQYRQN